jgi:integrase
MADRVGGGLDRHYKGSTFQADDDPVFAHPATGLALDRHEVSRRFKVALKRAGVREVRFHDLRHTFGTRMAAAGVPMRTLQEWMGHADIKTTLIYAHYAPNPNEAAMVNAAFAGPVCEADDKTDDKLSKSARDSEQEDPANRS